jgi:hypothetical protein
MTRNPSRLYRLIEERLDGTLVEFVDERRRPDVRPPASWDAIAAELSEKTGIEISRPGLRKWFGTDDESAIDSPATAGAGGRGNGTSVPAGDVRQGTGPRVPGHTRTSDSDTAAVS